MLRKRLQAMRQLVETALLHIRDIKVDNTYREAEVVVTDIIEIREVREEVKFSLNDHKESYTTVLIEREGGVATVVKRSEEELNTDKLISRENDISLQGTVTTAAAAREAGEEEEENVIIRAVLLQSVNTTVSAFNQAFLTVTETAAAS
ncbi:hypothetical protein BDDG_05735 [Blastomyces dermatitidis ATCC 18188]|uniref:Uncharacterized protein n=1 Tax=Ajellomyces dermatitidis (strain ATCC 18188 / CBS 674.68) TaxID=653446 RepID=F2THS8_AJEDA|nr:hypothetical protein BDDG_05735 [Blastomyces dermatitidis ATCC 18188]